MSDEALRRSERRRRGGGDAEGLARHLLARVRAGGLPDEARHVAERLAAGETSVEDVLLAGLGGHPWARDVAAEALAERLAYEGRERALDVTFEDGPFTTQVLVEWLDAVRVARPALLGVVVLRVHEHLRVAIEALPPPVMEYSDRERSLRSLGRAQEALAAWLDAGREPGRGPDDTYVHLDDDAGVAAAVEAAARAGALIDERPWTRAVMREWVDGVLPLIPSPELRAIAVAVLARPMLGERSP